MGTVSLKLFPNKLKKLRKLYAREKLYYHISGGKSNKCMFPYNPQANEMIDTQSNLKKTRVFFPFFFEV